MSEQPKKQQFTQKVRRGLAMLLELKLAQHVEEFKTLNALKRKGVAFTKLEVMDLDAAIVWIKQEAAKEEEQSDDEAPSDSAGNDGGQQASAGPASSEAAA